MHKESTKIMNARTTTFADVLRPTGKRATQAYDLTIVIGGSLIVALAAQIAFRLPFSPVPITGQTFGVLLIGTLLGRRRGVMSLLTYLVEGLIGLPVFAGGSSGLAYMLGPTGGYLFGFIAAAFLTGWLAERRWDRHVSTAVLSMLIGNAAIYTTGLGWLSIYVPNQSVTSFGAAPFLIGDITKIALAATLLPAGWKLLNLARADSS
jgi:biotin transport system substrate-specific component